MPPRSKVFTLPTELRDELNARLVGSGFSNYQGLQQWLEGQGYEFSIGGLHRYGSKLETDFNSAMADVQRTQQLAKMLVAGNDEDRGELMEASEKIAQDGLIRLQLALREAEADPLETANVLPKITRAIADLSRAGISRNKWQQDTREKIQSKMNRLESEAGSTASRRKIDPETLRIVRQEIYGII